jgi:hypothetical protein
LRVGQYSSDDSANYSSDDSANLCLQFDGDMIAWVKSREEKEEAERIKAEEAERVHATQLAGSASAAPSNTTPSACGAARVRCAIARPPLVVLPLVLRLPVVPRRAPLPGSNRAQPRGLLRVV